MVRLRGRGDGRGALRVGQPIGEATTCSTTGEDLDRPFGHVDGGRWGWVDAAVALLSGSGTPSRALCFAPKKTRIPSKIIWFWREKKHAVEKKLLFF
jgi:hypothetical protein